MYLVSGLTPGRRRGFGKQESQPEPIVHVDAIRKHVRGREELVRSADLPLWRNNGPETLR